MINSLTGHQQRGAFRAEICEAQQNNALHRALTPHTCSEMLADAALGSIRLKKGND
jgi:hypothetical protein